MAASDNGNHRRQRRGRQLKPQPVPPPQEMARISTESGSSKRQGMTVPRSRRLPTNLKQNQLPHRDRLNWWEQLFGQTSRRPTPPTRRLEKNKLVPVENIAQQAFGQTTAGNRINLPDQRSARSRLKPNPIAPSSQPQTKRNISEISAAKIRNLHLNQPKSREKNLIPPDPSRRFRQQNLVSLAPPSSRQVPPSKNQQTKKSLPARKTASGMQSSHPRNKRNSKSRQNLKTPQRSTISPLLYSSRLLILGIGLSVVIGTLLSIWNPPNQKTSQKADAVNSSEPSPKVTGISLKSASTQSNNLQALELRHEITSLKTDLQALANNYPQLTPGIFVLEIDTGAYLDWNADLALAAASTIKVPILVAFFQDVDAGKIRLDEQLTLEKEDIASGSGKMRYKPAGTTYTALETATQMIISSDNSATNMLIARLGGAEALNQRFQAWGLQATLIRNKLPDIEGTNTTSAKELASLIAQVNQGELVSPTSRDRLLDIMQRTQNRSLLPKGLGKEATIAHKTGHIGSLVADVGLIDLPSGKRYIISVMVKRPRNDAKATEFVNKISRLVYQHFHPPVSRPKLPAEDSAIPANSILSAPKNLPKPNQT